MTIHLIWANGIPTSSIVLPDGKGTKLDAIREDKRLQYGDDIAKPPFTRNQKDAMLKGLIQEIAA